MGSLAESPASPAVVYGLLLLLSVRLRLYRKQIENLSVFSKVYCEQQLIACSPRLCARLLPGPGEQ